MKLDDLMRYLLPHVPGAPDVTAKQALLLATIDFCVNTHAWSVILDPMDIEANMSEYDIEVEQGARVAAVKDVWMVGGRRLEPVTMDKLATVLPDWQTISTSAPMFYTAPVDNETIQIYPKPSVDLPGALTIRVAYAPTLTATSVPDSVVQLYLENLLHGARYRLMAMPEKSWSNEKLAAYHKTQFDDGVVSAKIDIAHDKVQGSIRVKPIRFGS